MNSLDYSETYHQVNLGAILQVQARAAGAGGQPQHPLRSHSMPELHGLVALEKCTSSEFTV